MGPRAGCSMCDDLEKRYPSKGKDEMALMAEHFPDAELVTNESEERYWAQKCEVPTGRKGRDPER